MVNETCLCIKNKFNCVHYPPIGYHHFPLFSPKIQQASK
jgi:hypothetical protein